MAASAVSTMGKAGAECVKNPGRPSFWIAAERRYICPDGDEARPPATGQIDHAAVPASGRIDPKFKLVFLTAAGGTLLFTLTCVALQLATKGELPPAQKELSDSILTMAKIGFGAIVGLLGGKVL